MTRIHHIPASKPVAAKESHQTIQDQTQAFLAQGGQIQAFDLGMTGQVGISTQDFTIVHEANHYKAKMKPALAVKVELGIKKQIH